MKLIAVKLKNFRGYRDEIIVPFENMTAFIGKNDAGKSTILEALEIFFNSSNVVCEKADLNIDAETENIEITCVFKDLPDSLTLDTSSITSLEKEYLLNQDNELEIKKIYRASTAKPKAKVFIVCKHPVEEPYNDLLTLKRKQLQDLIKTLEIDNNTYNGNNNASMRHAIWASYPEKVLALQSIPADKEDAKNVYDALSNFLPIYSLFQSDRASKDDDKEVSDPMKLAVEQALKELSAELDEIKESVKSKALETAERTLSKLQEMDKDLAQSLVPEFKSEPKFDSLFKLNIHSDDGISINKRGSGVRRLILLNFFRAEAERKLKDSDTQNIIYAFEEPETSQHPKHQEMLIESFIKLAYNSNSQVILTTHTPVLASLLPLESLRFITQENHNRVIKYDSDSVYQEITETLGILPDTFTRSTKAILLLEGQGDIIFMQHLCSQLKQGGAINETLQEKGFAFIPTGGCGNLKSWTTLKLAEQFGVPWCVLQDSDRPTPESEKNLKMINDLKSNGVKAYLTRKREPENYLHSDCFEFDIIIDDFIDAKKHVNQIDKKTARGKVLEVYWPKMSYDNIREMEKYTDQEGITRYEFTEMIEDFMELVD